MPSFSDIPAEIAFEIVQKLCPHCAPETRYNCYDDKICIYNSGCGCYHETNNPADVSALARLCLTSKHINAIVTPHLYHRPTCAKWWLLARTLLARPDLGCHVKHLQAHFFILSNHITPQSFPREVLDYYFEDQSKVRKLYRATKKSPGDRLEWQATAALGILTSLCPNLESLDAVVGPKSISGFAVINDEPLNHLRDVKLYYADKEDGMGVGHIMSLASAAPHLTHFVCHSLDGNARPFDLSFAGRFAFADLVDLRLDHSAVCADYLSLLLAACPRLQSFSYDAGGWKVSDRQFTPWDAQEALVRHVPDLVSLSLNYGENSREFARLPLDAKVQMSSLAGMSKLEHMALDMACIVNVQQTRGVDYYSDEGRSGPHAEPLALVNLLPASVRSLKLRRDSFNGPSFMRARTTFRRLTDVLPERFPNFKEITLSGVGEMEEAELDLRGVKLGFEAHGIKVIMLEFDL